MQFIYMGLILCGTVAAMLFVKSLDLGNGLTIALVGPVVLLAIFGLAWAAKEPEGKKNDSKMTHH